MQQLTIDEKRLTLLLHQEEILKEQYNSCYFDEFLKIGFMDFFLLSYSNQECYPKQENIIQCFEKGEDFHYFFDYFCLQINISMNDLIQTFFQAMQSFYHTNILMRIHMIHMAHSYHQEYLNRMPYYPDYMWEYAINAEGWIQMLNVIIDTIISNQEENLFLVVEFFQQQLEIFPENIRQSILINIGLKLGIVLYHPQTFFNDSNFCQWLNEEIKKRKARQQRTKICGN
jgi:hypothetical protein